MVLTEVGIECVALHSMIPQRLRLAALTKFKSSRAKIMVATDVGSRYITVFVAHHHFYDHCAGQPLLAGTLS